VAAKYSKQMNYVQNSFYQSVSPGCMHPCGSSFVLIPIFSIAVEV
jgi:hypothetical protein